jgi:hypothetical protein
MPYTHNACLCFALRITVIWSDATDLPRHDPMKCHADPRRDWGNHFNGRLLKKIQMNLVMEASDYAEIRLKTINITLKFYAPAGT